MSTNNDVYQVLVIPNTAAAVKDKKNVSALANGAWGVFNYDDNVGIDLPAAGTTALPARWYFAYRGGGTTAAPGKKGFLYTSAGTHIQTRNMRSATGSVSKAPTAQELILTDQTIQSGPDATNYDYMLKIEFRGNTEVYQRYGANQASKFFSANTRCVGAEPATAAGVTTAETADVEAAAQWAAGISYDTDMFLGVQVTVNPAVDGSGTDVLVKYDYNATTTNWEWTIGSGAATTEALALAAIRAGLSLGEVRIFVHPLSSLYHFCNVNPKYFKQRQITGIPSLGGGSCRWGTFVEDPATGKSMGYEIGRGYDIQELEYVAGGWNGKPGPYRQSRLHGLPFMDFEYNADRDHYYNVYTFQYDQFSVGGWLEYLNNQSTYIAVDVGATAATVTLVALLADLNKIASLSPAQITPSPLV